MGLFNNTEIELLKEAGIKEIEQVEYTNEEKKIINMQVKEFIMNHSSKNGDIGRLLNKYDNILNVTNVKWEVVNEKI